MDELSNEEVAVISSAIFAYLEYERKEKEIFPNKWKIEGRKESLKGSENIMKYRKLKVYVGSKWKIAGRLG